MKKSRLQFEVDALRAFNRLYTSRLGLLNDRLDGSPYPLTEARVLYELAHNVDTTAAQITRQLGMDKAQLSRIVRKFTEQGLVQSVVSEQHAKHNLLSLTAKGRKTVEGLEAATNKAVGALLEGFTEAERRRLLSAVGELSAVLGGRGN